jgi:poly(3-hydroxyalkanoate) synthetase
MDELSKKTAGRKPDVPSQRRATAAQLATLLDAWMRARTDETDLASAEAGFAADPVADLLRDTLKPLLQERPGVTPDSPTMNQFLEGLAAYQQHPTARDAAQPSAVLWQQGTTVLRDYGASRPGDAAVFVVPSLINRFNILDVAPDHSFLRFLAASGLRPLVLDWSEPGDEEKEFTIADYVTKRLMPAVDFLTPRVAGGRLHLIGYCMGGLLALALASLRPDVVNKLALMATPWNFSSGIPGTSLTSGEAFIKLADRVEPYLAREKYLSAQSLQVFFASFQPMQLMEKFARFAAFDPASEEAQRFVLSEDWLNDGVPLAAPVARECLRAWYGENRPGKILWRVAGTLIDPRLLNCPAYIVVPGKDRLVPPESARPLARLMRGAKLHEPMLGHVGLLTSHVAPQEVWTPLARWLLDV